MHCGIRHYMKPPFSIHVNLFILIIDRLELKFTFFLVKDILFTKSGVESMLPTPVVIKNYRAFLTSTSTNSNPNQDSNFI